MFTGIIESTGEVVGREVEGANITFCIRGSISPELKVDQSVAHNGVCLTVVETGNEYYKVTAIDETLQKTNLGKWQLGTLVNLERCMQLNGRLDGHLVQGHVDQVAIVKSIKDKNGSWLYQFEHDGSGGYVTVEKGSICVNGVSLTCFDTGDGFFSVAIIPYTYEHTNFRQLKVGDTVNLEFDIIGKYIKRLMQR